ncbi:MAG: DUF2812 domain-containing protein [Chloroflexota bacterium]
MDRTTCKKFKWFWAWNDHKEEEWLQQMSQGGWHLKSLALPGVYEFEKGEPRRYVYRLDFVTSANKDYQAYLQLFADAGWQHIGVLGSWQYFRIEASEGEQPEIYTDNSSKIQKYQRLMTYLVIFLPIYFIFMSNITNSEHELMRAIGVVFAAFMVFYAYAMLRILMRISQLKKQL